MFIVVACTTTFFVAIVAHAFFFLSCIRYHFNIPHRQNPYAFLYVNTIIALSTAICSQLQLQWNECHCQDDILDSLLFAVDGKFIFVLHTHIPDHQCVSMRQCNILHMCAVCLCCYMAPCLAHFVVTAMIVICLEEVNRKLQSRSASTRPAHRAHACCHINGDGAFCGWWAIDHIFPLIIIIIIISICLMLLIFCLSLARKLRMPFPWKNIWPKNDIIIWCNVLGAGIPNDSHAEIGQYSKYVWELLCMLCGHTQYDNHSHCVVHIHLWHLRKWAEWSDSEWVKHCEKCRFDCRRKRRKMIMSRIGSTFCSSLMPNLFEHVCQFTL